MLSRHVLAALVLLFALSVAARAADFPTGTFAATIGGDAWEVAFSGDGHYTVSRGGEKGVEGSYKVEADQVELTDTGGPNAETGENQTGTYKWAFADGHMTFAVIKDKAKGRSSILGAGPWALK